ncbi:MAG: class I SAM-dependent methyltransferase [Chloroflexota bacterium]|nr:MAG: class I SAM-dependent methyltransferase [Chloroflexota bacterium]
MFDKLDEINSRPSPFQFYTAEDLWTDEHTSTKMLEYHLNEAVDLASRNKDFISRSVQWIVSHFKINSNTSIADFGCGPGLYTTQFAENKADVTGIDFSRRSIQYAKKITEQKELNITYFQQNYLEFETEKRFDLITMIFCDYCALSPSQRKTLLSKFYSFLKPGGSVLLDVHSINTFNSREEAASYGQNQFDGFWSKENYYGFINTFKYDEDYVTLDKYTIIEKARIRFVYNWLQYFSQDSLREELKENGFEVKEIYSDVAGSTFSSDSPDMAVVARKAKST